MNQILITKKLYVTPELKRKKKIYKIDFILSVFLVVVLISFYIYAEYGRSKDEDLAEDILASMSSADTNGQEELATEGELQENTENVEETVSDRGNNDGRGEGAAAANGNKLTKKVKTRNGQTYESVGTLEIPKIGLKYAIILPSQQTTEVIESLLKISPCKFWGPNINEVGNFCIVGHNYHNTKFFSKVPNLGNGDVIKLTDVNGGQLSYAVYDKYTVAPEDVRCTSQLTNGRKEVTLITCTDDNAQRWIIKGREIKN